MRVGGKCIFLDYNGDCLLILFCGLFQELYLYDSAGKEIFSENVVKFVSALYLQTLCITNNLVPLQTGVCMHVCVCVFLQVVCVCVRVHMVTSMCLIAQTCWMK